MQENNIFENEEIISEEESFSEDICSEETPKIEENFKYVQYIPYGLTPETYKERKEIKKTANAMSGSMLCVLGFSLLYGLLFPVLMMSLGYSMEKTYEILREPAFMQFFQILFSVFTFTVPFIVIYKFLRFRISDLIDFNTPKRENLPSFFLIGISFCSFSNIAISFASQIFENFGINYEVDYGDNPEGFFGFMLSLIATVIVPALVEEFAFRGIILGSLKKFGEGFAVIVSSVLFGLMHGNFEQIPFAFLVGLVLGFITVKSGSIWIAVLIHAFNNFISVFFNYFMNGFSMEIQNIFYTIFLSVTLLLGIIGVLTLKNYSEVLSFNKSETEAGEKTKYKWVFTTPLFIIFVVLTFVMSLMYFK